MSRFTFTKAVKKAYDDIQEPSPSALGKRQIAEPDSAGTISGDERARKIDEILSKRQNTGELKERQDFVGLPKLNEWTGMPFSA